MQTGGSCNFCYACGFKNTPAPITVPITVDKAVKIPSYVLIHFLFLLLLLAWLDILPSLVPFHTIANPKSIKNFWMWFLFYTVSTNFSFSFSNISFVITSKSYFGEKPHSSCAQETSSEFGQDSAID